jgi:hypothetical protein
MNASQNRAVANHRRRLTERGITRYEVRGLEQDKELVRKFANRLAANDPEAQRLRQQVADDVLKKRSAARKLWRRCAGHPSSDWIWFLSERSPPGATSICDPLSTRHEYRQRNNEGAAGGGDCPMD